MPKPQTVRAEPVGAATGSLLPFHRMPDDPVDRLVLWFGEAARILSQPGAVLDTPEAQEWAEGMLASVARLEQLIRFGCSGEGKEKYGLTADDFWDMVFAQDFRCAICTTEFVPEGKRGVVDHNHATGEVRAVLCTSCNTGIGQLQDSPDVLRRAVAYLESWGYYGPDLP